MLEVTDLAGLVGRRARLVFRTTHIDRAGETSDVRAVDAEIVALDATGGAVLVTDDGLHFRFPAARLVDAGGAAEVLGGQELVRDFHSAETPVALRWLSGEGLAQAVAEVERAGSRPGRSGGEPARKRRRRRSP